MGGMFGMIARIALSLVYAAMAGQASICSHERPAEHHADHRADATGEPELVCAGDCQSIDPVGLPSSPPLRAMVLPRVGLPTVTVPSRALAVLHDSTSRGPPDSVRG